MEATSGTPAPSTGSGAVEADGIRAIPEAVRAAARQAPGHWIGVVDPEWTEERTPPDWAVLGEWRSDDDGDVGTFRANPAYRPSARALGWPSPPTPWTRRHSVPRPDTAPWRRPSPRSRPPRSPS